MNVTLQWAALSKRSFHNGFCRSDDVDGISKDVDNDLQEMFFLYLVILVAFNGCYYIHILNVF